MESAEPSWRVAVFVCHNQRDPRAERPSCGEAAGRELRAWLRDRLRERGLLRDILCARSGCLDVCSGRGTTVAVMRADGAPRRILVVGDRDRDALLDLVVEAARAPVPPV